MSLTQLSDAGDPARRPAIETAEKAMRLMRDLSAVLATLSPELWGYDAPDGTPPIALDRINLHNELLAHAPRLSARRDELAAARGGKRSTRPERPLPRLITDVAADAFKSLNGYPPIRTDDPWRRSASALPRDSALWSRR